MKNTRKNEIASASRGRTPAQRARNHNRGETLIEVLMSLSVLSILLLPSGQIFQNSIRNTDANRKELIAAALAEEALATMDGIARTNILRFSPKANVCWNAKPGHSVLTDEANSVNNCENNAIAEGWHKLGVDLTNSLRPPTLELAPNPFDPSNPAEEYRLKLNGDPLIYTHSDAGSSTPFYRSIEIRYADLTQPSNDNSQDAMKIIVTVAFRAAGQMKKVTIPALIKPE